MSNREINQVGGEGESQRCNNLTFFRVYTWKNNHASLCVLLTDMLIRKKHTNRLLWKSSNAALISDAQWWWWCGARSFWLATNYASLHQFNPLCCKGESPNTETLQPLLGSSNGAATLMPRIPARRACSDSIPQEPTTHILLVLKATSALQIQSLYSPLCTPLRAAST